MSLTTSQILSAIRRKILEETTSLVSDDTALMNANLAYDDLKIKTFTNDQIQSATVSFINGVGTLPTDFGTLYGPGYYNTIPYNEVSISEFDRNSDIEAVTIEGGQIKVNPSTTPILDIKYYPSYDALTTSQNPEINPYLHELIIYGAIWRILEDLQNEALSEYYKNKYAELLKDKTSALSNYEESNDGGNSFFNGIKII